LKEFYYLSVRAEYKSGAKEINNSYETEGSIVLIYFNSNIKTYQKLAKLKRPKVALI
jgi:hypothetical protein